MSQLIDLAKKKKITLIDNSHSNELDQYLKNQAIYEKIQNLKDMIVIIEILK